jgi:hypothetical protein
MYLAAVDVPVLDSRGHEPLAGDVETLRVGLDDGRAVGLIWLVQDGHDGLQFVRLDLVCGVSDMVARLVGFDHPEWFPPTSNSGVVAQVLSPAALTMQALSMWPEPTRLLETS